MSWADRRARVLSKAPTLTVDDVFSALLERDAQLYVEDGQLQYAGPDLTSDDPIHAGLAEHREILTEWFTYAPGRRCRYEGCYRLRVVGDSTSCAEHRSLIDALAATWES